MARRSGTVGLDVVIVVCLDLEGVLIPEIWISVAQSAGVDDLLVTTRDIPDYDELMRHRLRVVEREGLRIGDIQKVIATLAPLPGAKDFLDELRTRYQVIILSDTFYQFATPLMRQLGWPTLFCHRLITDADGRIIDYRLRQADQKRQAVKALHGLNFKTVAAGDSYNDTTMLAEANGGILFRPPQQVVDAFPQYPVVTEYAELSAQIERAAGEILAA